MLASAPPIAESAAVMAVSCRGVSKAYRATGRRGESAPALDGVSLQLPAGTFLALLGPNGSGKSTLMRILATSLLPDAGEVRMLGHDVLSPSAVRVVRRRLGVVFQLPSLDDLLTIRENLLVHAAIHGLDSAGGRAAVERIAAAVGIADRLDQRVGTLSGGLARRADLARALLPDPDLLLLDEPTSGLDPRARTEFLDLLTTPRAGEATARTIILSTHHMDEASRADRVALMHRGKIMREGSPTELRQALGAAIVRATAAESTHARAEARAIMEQRGMNVSEEPGGVLRGSGREPEQVHAAAGALAAAGVAFEFGPPTLGDVYLDATGESLKADEVRPELRRARRGGRRV